VSEIFSLVQVVAAVAGGWVLVSLLTTAALLPVFRTMSRVNALEKLQARSDEWAMRSMRSP
jgi:hypothetical protein